MKKNALLIFIVLFSFCNKKESNLPKIIVPEQKNFIEVNSKEMLNIEDFIALPITPDNDFKGKELNYSKGISIPEDSILPKYNLKIIIDDSYTIARNSFYYKRIPYPENIVKYGLFNGRIPSKEEKIISQKNIIEHQKNTYKLLEDYVECYPVLIFNNSNEGVLFRSKLIQEAKDIDGKWKPIEFCYFHIMCGILQNSYPFLDSKNYIAYPIIKYNGNFKTKIRVKVKNINNIYYSNEIDATINRSQFNQDFLNLPLQKNTNENLESFKNHIFLNK